MRSWLLRLSFSTIVAVFPLRPAAAAGVTEDVPLPGGTAALARALGIDPVPDRSRFMFEITRLLYNTPEGRRPSADAFLQALRQSVARARRLEVPVDTRPAELVPVPLNAELWSSAVFHRKVAPRELVPAIVADRSAALLCLGLAALDDRTLEYFADHPLLIERIYERSAPAFGAFSSSLRIQDNRVVPPGARAPSRGESLGVAPRKVEERQAQGDRDEVTALWEAVIPEKMTRPERFVLQLLELNEGRFFYLYDVIGQLDPPRRAFALGLWMTNAAARTERFKALTAGVGVFRESQLRTLPLGRASYDLSMTLMRIEVGPDGTPLPPASRGLWSRVFGGADLPDDPVRRLRNAEDDPIDAAWLIDTIGSVEVRLRAERLDQLSFGQRVFAGAAETSERGDVLVALRAFSRYRMLLWTFERIGIRAPAAYATAARRAARIGALEGRRGFEAQAQFQGALALLTRMAGVGTLDAPRAQKLIERLMALPTTEDGRFAGAVARWLRDDLAAAIASAPTTEAAVLAAMSGPASDGAIARPVTWEGQGYRLDLGAAERRRLQRVREKQEGVPLDAALDVAAAGRALRAEKLALDDAESIVARLSAVVTDIPRRVGHDGEDSTPTGLTPAPNAADALRKAIDELSRDIRNKDVKKAARMAEALIELGDTLLAEALPSIAYAADVGDPDGAVLLADDVSRRHDFGFGGRDAETRARLPWAVPRADVTPGVPWHITGSLLGLDLGLAPLALRRLNYERVLEAPKLTSNERDAFALSVSLMSPFALHDADRDAIADAFERGRRRVAALATPSDRGRAASRPNDDAAFDRLADELSMEAWRRRAVRWTLAHEANRIESMFSSVEMLVLGGGKTADLDAWGMAMVTLQGCICSRLTPPGRWPNLLGRPQLGLTASAVADLNLHVAIMLKELHLPAALAKVVLSGAMQDFIDEVRPTDDADWLTLSRAARVISRDRIEDYIAAATAAGPLIPDAGLRHQD